MWQPDHAFFWVNSQQQLSICCQSFNNGHSVGVGLQTYLMSLSSSLTAYIADDYYLPISLQFNGLM